jgi:hypothetical protein
MRVRTNAYLVGLEGRPVDEAWMVITDDDAPFGARQTASALAHAPKLVDVALVPGFPIDVRASIDGVREHLMDLRVCRHDPRDLAERARLERPLQILRAQPEPHLAHGAHLGEAVEHGAEHTDDRFVVVHAHLTVGVAPHEADGQPATEFTALGLVPNAAGEPSAEDMKLCLGHRALETEHQAIVEQPRVIDAIAIADERVGDAAQIEEPVPAGVVACEPRNFEAEHDADVSEGDIRGQARETGTLDEASAGDAG